MTESEHRLIIDLHENPNCRTYHIDRRFYGSRLGGSGSNEPVLSRFDERLRPNDPAVKLMERLETVPGVVGCQFRLYRVIVFIGEAFRWKDVGPKVVGELVKTVYPNISGHTLEVSAQAVPDSRDRAGYREIVKDRPVQVDFGATRPVLDIEDMLGDAPKEAGKSKEGPGASKTAALHAA